MFSFLQVLALIPFILVFLLVFLLFFVPLLFTLFSIDIIALVLLPAPTAEVVIVVLVLDMLVLLVPVLPQQLPLELPGSLLGVHQGGQLRVLVPLPPAPVYRFFSQKLGFYGVLHLQHVLALYV